VTVYRKHFSELAPHHDWKTVVTKKLRQCHSMYTATQTPDDKTLAAYKVISTDRNKILVVKYAIRSKQCCN